MGMESFFISVFPKNMTVDFVNGMRKINGIDKRYDLDWNKELRTRLYDVVDDHNCYIVDSCIEFYINETSQGGIQIDLIGCLSCYTYALEKMDKLIKDIGIITNSTPYVFACGDVFEYDENDFITRVENGYNTKKEAFNKMFTNEIFIVYPKDFYNYFDSKKSIIQGISKSFKK